MISIIIMSFCTVCNCLLILLGIMNFWSCWLIYVHKSWIFPNVLQSRLWHSGKFCVQASLSCTEGPHTERYKNTCLLCISKRNVTICRMHVAFVESYSFLKVIKPSEPERSCLKVESKGQWKSIKATVYLFNIFRSVLASLCMQNVAWLPMRCWVVLIESRKQICLFSQYFFALRHGRFWDEYLKNYMDLNGLLHLLV